MSGFLPVSPEAGGEDGDKPNPVMGEFFGDKHPYREDDADGSERPGHPAAYSGRDSAARRPAVLLGPARRRRGCRGG